MGKSDGKTKFETLLIYWFWVVLPCKSVLSCILTLMNFFRHQENNHCSKIALFEIRPMGGLSFIHPWSYFGDF